MNLTEQFKKDIITAMKEKDKRKLDTLRSVKGAIQLEIINNRKEENDELLLDVISKQIKLRKNIYLHLVMFGVRSYLEE